MSAIWAALLVPVNRFLGLLEALADGWRLGRKNTLLIEELKLRHAARQLRQQIWEKSQSFPPDQLEPLYGLLQDIETDLGAVRSARSADVTSPPASGDEGRGLHPNQ